MTRDDIARQLAAHRRRRDANGADTRGDHDLNGDKAPRLDLRPAAVLVPLVERPEGFTVILTQRTADLPSHAGQVAFPGGRTQAEDADAIATALRETEEEIGLPPRQVEVLGDLDLYITGTGFAVTPIVGVIEPPIELRPDPREVADIFEVPLAFFMDPANHELRSAVWQGRERRFYVMPYENRYIWGATAGMLKNLQTVLTAT